MPVEKAKKPAGAEEAAKKAEAEIEFLKKTMPAFAPAPPKAKAEAELVKSIEAAENAVKELGVYSKAVEKKLPLDVGYEANKMLADLAKTKVKEIEIMGVARYKEETADIEKTIKEAQKTEKAGKHDGAVELIESAKKKMDTLTDIISLQRKLAVAGAPSELIDAVEKAYCFFGTAQESRGQLVFDAATFYLEHPRLKAEGAEKVAENLIGVISEIADESKKIDAGKAKETLDKIYAGVEKASNELALEQKSQLDAVHETLKKVYDAQPEGKFKEQLGALMKEVEDVNKKLADEKMRGQVSGEEIAKIGNAIWLALAMADKIALIENKDTAGKVGAIYGNSLEALLKGNEEEEAHFHEILASEYLINNKDNKYRQELISTSNKLSKGEIDYADAYSAVYTTLYEKARGREDEGLDGFLATLKQPSKLTEKDMATENLIALREGLHLSEQVEYRLKGAKGAVKEGVGKIAGQAYSALAAGDLDVVDIQKELLANYAVTLKDWERSGIENLSGMLAKNPELKEAALQYIRLAEFASTTESALYGTKGKMRDVIANALGFIENLEKKALGGTMLTDDEKNQATMIYNAAITAKEKTAKLKGETKDGALTLYGLVIDFAGKGDAEMAGLMSHGASLLPALSEKDGKAIFSKCSGVAEGTFTVEEAKAFLQIYEGKANAGAIENEQLKKEVLKQYDLALSFAEKGDYNSAALVATAAGIAAQAASLPPELRKDKNVKGALDYVSSVMEYAEGALADGEMLADAMGTDVETLGTELQLHAFAIENAQLKADFEKAKKIATKKKYENENANYASMMAAGEEAIKLHSEGIAKINEAIGLAKKGEQEKAKELLAEGFSMTESAKAMMLALRYYNISVMRVDTKAKGSGRAELLDAIKILSAIGNGYALDSSGAALKDEKGEPVLLDAATAAKYAELGGSVLAAGIQGVSVQMKIKETENRLVKKSDNIIKLADKTQYGDEKHAGIEKTEMPEEEKDKALDDIKKAKAKAAKAKMLAQKENFAGSSKALGFAGAHLDCAAKAVDNYTNENDLKKNQVETYAKVKGETLAIVGELVGMSPSEDIFNDGSALTKFEPPGFTKYDAETNAAEIDRARAELDKGNLGKAHKKLSQVGDKMEKDFDTEYAEMHWGAYAQGAQALSWFATNLPVFFTEPAPGKESAIDKENRYKRNDAVADALKPFQEALESYHLAMEKIANKWEKVQGAEASRDDALDMEGKLAGTMHERALAWSLIPAQLGIAFSGMKNADAVELYSKAPGATKTQAVGVLQASSGANLAVAGELLANADNTSAYLDAHGTEFAANLLKQKQAEFGALGSLGLFKEETKGYGLSMAKWETENTLAKMGYKINWEGGAVGSIEKLELDSGQIAALHDASSKFNNMRNMFADGLVGPGGTMSKLFSADEQAKLMSGITASAKQYHDAVSSVVAGESAESAAAYIAKGDSWWKEKYYEVAKETGMSWKTIAKAALVVNPTTTLLGLGWIAYDKMKPEETKMVGELEYRMAEFQKAESYARMAKMGGDIAISGALFALAPLSAGTTALAGAGYMTATMTAGLAETYHTSGGWEYMTSGQKALFVFDASLTVLGAAIPIGGLIIDEAGMAVMATEGLANEAMELTGGMKTFATAMTWTGVTMIGAGTVRGLIDAPNILEAVSKGQMSGAEAAFIFANTILPFAQIGLHGIHIAKTAKMGGMPEFAYRSKPQQFFEAILLGTPVDDPFVHQMSKEMYYSSKALSKMDAGEKAVWSSYVGAVGEKNLSPAAEAKILEGYTAWKEGNPKGYFEEYLIGQKYVTAEGTPNYGKLGIEKPPGKVTVKLAKPPEEMAPKPALSELEMSQFGEFKETLESLPFGIKLMPADKSKIIDTYLKQQQQKEPALTFKGFLDGITMAKDPVEALVKLKVWPEAAEAAVTAVGAEMGPAEAVTAKPKPAEKIFMTPEQIKATLEAAKKGEVPEIKEAPPKLKKPLELVAVEDAIGNPELLAAFENMAGLDAETWKFKTAEISKITAYYLEHGQKERTNLLHYAKLAKNKQGYALLKELEAVTGTKGKAVAEAYGVGQEALVKAYEDATTLSEARGNVAELLGITLEKLPAFEIRQDDYVHFNTLNDDYFLWGLLLDGNLLNVMDSMPKGGQIKKIEFINGLLGAYEVTTEGGVNYYVRKIDCAPDAMGSLAAKKSGMPAPDVSATDAKGKLLEYTDAATGEKVDYGITTDMRNFEGIITRVGKKIQAKAAAAAEMGKIGENKELSWVLGDETYGQFATELGYALTGQQIAGFWDGTHKNMWFMKLELTGPEAKANFKALKEAGHIVREEDGKYYLYAFGRIDLDSAGTYIMEFTATGEASFDSLIARYGDQDYKKVFNALYKLKYGEAPADAVKYEAFVSEAFTHFEEGAAKWHDEFLSTPGKKKAYVDGISAEFIDHDGEQAGVSFGTAMTENGIQNINAGMVHEFQLAYIGEDAYPINSMDGRAEFMAERERMATSVPLEKLKGTELYEAIANQPEALVNYAAPKGKISAGTLSTFQKYGATVFSHGGEEYLFIAGGTLKAMDEAAGTAVPAEITKIKKARLEMSLATEKGDFLYIYHEGGKMSVADPAFFDREVVAKDTKFYIIPAEGVSKTGDGKLVSLGLGADGSTILKPKKFIVYESMEQVPAALKDKVAVAKRHGNKIILEKDGGEMLGLAPNDVVKTGAVASLEYIAGMTPEELKAKIWDPVRKEVIKKESEKIKAKKDKWIAAAELVKKSMEAAKAKQKAAEEAMAMEPTVAPGAAKKTAEEAITAPTVAAPAVKPPAKAVPGEPRYEAQKKAFLEKPLDEKAAVKSLVDGAKTEAFESDFVLTIAKLHEVKKLEPKIVAEIKEMALKQVQKELGVEKAKKFDKYFDLLMKITKYKPILEVGKIANEAGEYADVASSMGEYDNKMLKHPQELETLKGLVFDKGKTEDVYAHGIEAGKGGLANFTNILLEGWIYSGHELPFKAVLMEGDMAYTSGGHGPYYVILDNSAGYVKGKAPKSNYLPEKSHIAYIVPDAEAKGLVLGALDKAAEKGLITQETRDMLAKKVITYQEFLDAPKGTFATAENFQKYVAGKAKKKQPPAKAA